LAGGAGGAEVAAKLDRVRGWLTGSGYGAALFTSQPAVAWVTGGLEDRVVRNEEPALVWALVTETAAFLVTTNIEQPRLRAEADLGGFELHAVPWYSSGGLAEAAGSLAGGQKLTEAPASLRMPLVAAETERLVALGADCAQALEGVGEVRGHVRRRPRGGRPRHQHRGLARHRVRPAGHLARLTTLPI
jgi:hypothetical protein